VEAVEVVGISIFPPFQGYGIILREQRDGGRWFPIFIGPAEAQTISMLLRMVKHERPLTFDMFQSVLEASNIHVEKVSVTELKNNTFFAEISLRRDNDVKVIDARPSDGIALALRTGAPIFVSERILDETGFTGEVGEQPVPSTETSISSPEQELSQLQQQLEELVSQERYEEAAKMRDRIRELLKNVSEPHQE